MVPNLATERSHKTKLVGNEVVGELQHCQRQSKTHEGKHVDRFLKILAQCSAASKKINKRLGIVKKGTKTSRILYKLTVHLHLGYYMKLWSPHPKKGAH